MRDISHSEQIERWAEHIKNNPDWKKEFNKFIDAQIEKANNFYKNLEKTEEGRKIIKELLRAKIVKI
jgi:hypothetical protein